MNRRWLTLIVALVFPLLSYAEEEAETKTGEEKVSEEKVETAETESTDSAWTKKVNIGGEMRFRAYFRDNRDFNTAINDRQDFIGSRIRLNVAVEPIESLKAFVQPQFTGAWGQAETNINASAGVAPGTLTSGALNDRELTLHQGYILWKMTEHTALKAGRQELIYGDHLVIGNVGWSDIGRSFDAGKIQFGLNQGQVDLFYARLAENDVNGPGFSGNDDFAGLYAAFEEVARIDELDVYGLWLRRAKNFGPHAFNFGTFGTRAKAKYHGFDSRFEGGVQLGKRAGQTMVAYMFDIEEGYTFDVQDGLRAAIEYNLASGDDPASSTFTRWHSLFPTAHKWLGFMDILGRQNIQSGVFHLKLQVDPQWSFLVDVHSFWRVKNQDLIYGLAAEAPVAGQGAAPATGKKHVGEEVDLTVNYEVNQHVSFQAVGALFFPGKYLSRTLGNDISYFSYLQGRFAF